MFPDGQTRETGPWETLLSLDTLPFPLLVA